MIAICPLCGQTVQLTEPLPAQISCPHCHAALSVKAAGLTAHLNPISGDHEETEAEKAVHALDGENDPVKKYAALTALEKAYPKSLSVQYALLKHGRLHERSPKKLDFSVIKCYLLHPYEAPGEHSPEEKKAFARELFDHPRLKICLSLSQDPEAFQRRYLEELCCQYFDLFLKGSSKYGTSFFGFAMSNRPEKTLARPVAAMCRAASMDANLSIEERALLKDCLYAAFEARFGDTSHLAALI